MSEPPDILTTDSYCISPQLTPTRFLLCGIPMISVTYGIGRYAYGLFLPDIMRDFSISISEAGVIAGLATATFTILAIIASVFAEIIRPISLIFVGGLLTAVGLMTVSVADDRLILCLGVMLASTGAAIAPPAYLEMAGRWLRSSAQGFSVTALNSGAAPGLILTASCAHYFPGGWRYAWISFAVLAIAVALINLSFLPKHIIPKVTSGELLGLRTILAPGALRLVIISFFYGFVISIFYVFSASLLENLGSAVGGISMWIVIGLFGIPAMYSNLLVDRLGAARVLSLSFLSLSIAAALIISGSLIATIVAAAAFGLFSLIPGSVCLVLATGIYRRRPSLGWGVNFVSLSAGMAACPPLAGRIGDAYDLSTAFLSISCISFITALILLIFPSTVPKITE